MSGSNDIEENGQSAATRHLKWGEKPLDCEDIQSVLFDYMAHELGESQSVLVHEHLRRCADCRAEAAEIEKTLSLLREPRAGDVTRLSDERRKRIMRAVFHPVIDWVDVHHRLVSLVLMLLILGLTLFILRNYAIFRRIKLEDAVQVHIGRVLPQAAQDQGVPEKVEVDGE